MGPCSQAMLCKDSPGTFQQLRMKIICTASQSFLLLQGKYCIAGCHGCHPRSLERQCQWGSAIVLCNSRWIPHKQILSSTYLPATVENILCVQIWNEFRLFKFYYALLCTLHSIKNCIFWGITSFYLWIYTFLIINYIYLACFVNSFYVKSLSWSK